MGRRVPVAKPPRRWPGQRSRLDGHLDDGLPQLEAQLVQEAPRATLRPHEAALVLQETERRVLRLVREGTLRNVSLDSRVRLDPDEIRIAALDAIEAGSLSHLALWALTEIVQHRRVVTPRGRPTRPPTSLIEFLSGRSQD